LSSLQIISIPGSTSGSGSGGTPTSSGGYVSGMGGGVLSGHGAPKATVGNIYDFWLDLDSYTLFGPKKIQSAWPKTGVSLIGASGAAGSAGPAGTLWFSGDGPPAEDNDYPAGSYYFDRINDVIYPPAI